MKIESISENESSYGPLDLLVLQGSPFCNINCRYCYLPNRLDKKRMSIDTIKAVFQNLFNTKIVRKDFTISWHAGEPLTVSQTFYEQAIEIALKLNNTNHKIRNNVQTNGTLINDSWCNFFKTYDVSVSVSIDGPEFIHNRNRVTRKGIGTFDKAIKGIEFLKKYDIPFNIISVISDYTLEYPDQFYEFFRELEPLTLGLSIEEIENANTNSVLFKNELNIARFQKFIKQIFQRYYTDNQIFNIREFKQFENFLIRDNYFMEGFGQQTVPYRILSIDADGNFSTFSPELLNAPSKHYGNFFIGNVHRDDFLSVLSSEKFDNIYSDLVEGIILCKRSCEHFSVCGGGTPSNKYSENGTFISTETNFCKYRFQTLFDTYIEQVEELILKK